MEGPIRVLVHAVDPVSQEGVASQLRDLPDVQIVGHDRSPEMAVAIVVGDEVSDEVLKIIRALKANGCRRVVLVVGRVDDAGLLGAVESGICGVLRRSEATREKLRSAVEAAAAGSGQLAPDLLGRLLDQMGQLYSTALLPKGLTLTGFTPREVGVLKLVAEGCATSEIATMLSYSERTVKGVLHDITTRLNLRNRSHAVAYAVRQGLI